MLGQGKKGRKKTSPKNGSLLKKDNKVSTYIQAFTSVELASLQPKRLLDNPSH
jgi:hypothetical protein